MKNFKIIFTERLRQLRQEKGLSRQFLSEKFQVAVSKIGHWETGRNEPSINELCQLSDLFNVSLDYLVGRSDKP